MWRTKLVLGRTQPLMKFLRQGLWGLTKLGEALSLAQPIGVDAGLILEIVGDYAIDLRKSQKLKFPENGFGRQAIVEALDNGVYGHASSGDVQTAVSLLHVGFRHRLAASIDCSPAHD